MEGLKYLISKELRVSSVYGGELVYGHALQISIFGTMENEICVLKARSKFVTYLGYYLKEKLCPDFQIWKSRR